MIYIGGWNDFSIFDGIYMSVLCWCIVSSSNVRIKCYYYSLLQFSGWNLRPQYMFVCLFVCLFVCWVIYFKVASILAAYLRYTRLRDPNHPRLANR